MHQQLHQEEALAHLPGKSAQAFQTHFTLLKAQRHLDLPATGIDADNLKGLFSGVDGFGSEQIPGLLARSLARDHQPEQLMMGRIENREG